jgi:hypothetical protein
MMGKERIKPTSQDELLRHYPIEGLLPDWYFRQVEKSPGVWDVEGRDAYGRIVSQTSAINEEQALKGCVEQAKQIVVKGGPI